MVGLDNTQLIIIDVQGKLSQLVYESEKVLKNIQILIQGCKKMEVPIVWVEQTPDKLGKTNPLISEYLVDYEPIAKKTFSAWGSNLFCETLTKHQRNEIILVGIEAHICVYQTALDLLTNGYEVSVVVDAISSRTSDNKHIGISMIEKIGVKITSTEALLFQLMKTTEHPCFKDIVRLIR